MQFASTSRKYTLYTILYIQVHITGRDINIKGVHLKLTNDCNKTFFTKLPFLTGNRIMLPVDIGESVSETELAVILFQRRKG